MVQCCDDVTKRCEAAVPMRVRTVLVVFGGILVHLTLGTFYTIGNVGPYTISYLRARATSPEASNTLVVWVVTACVVGQGLGMLLGGWLTHKLGPRTATAIGALLHSSGTLLTSLTVKVSFGALLASYGLMVGLGIGIAYPGPVSAAISWAPSRRGLVSGLILAGYGLGAVVFNPIITAYINPSNYNPDIIDKDSQYFGQADLLDRVPSCFLVLGCTYACMQTLGCLLIHRPPQTLQPVVEMAVITPSSSANDTTQLVGGSITPSYSKCDADQDKTLEKETGAKEAASQGGDREPATVLRSPLFYGLWVSLALGSIPVTVINGLYKAYGLNFIKDDHYLTGIGTFASIFNGLGRVMWGLVLDRLSIKITFLLVFLSLGGLTLLLLIQEKITFAIVVCLLFLSFSGIFVLVPVTASYLWGQTHFAFNYGLLWSSLVMGTVLASLLGQVLQQALGWVWVFSLCSAVTILGGIVVCFVKGRTAEGRAF